jgi:hypothetical protein
VRLRTGDGVDASDSGAVGRRLYGAGAVHGHVGPAQRVACQVKAAR